MRSRYTAYVLGDSRYLLATWHASTRPGQLNLKEEPMPRWLGLKVINHVSLGPDEARVAFVARYKIGGRASRLEENSRFLRENGLWFYVDGEIGGT